MAYQTVVQWPARYQQQKEGSDKDGPLRFLRKGAKQPTSSTILNVVCLLTDYQMENATIMDANEAGFEKYSISIFFALHRIFFKYRNPSSGFPFK